MATPIGSYFGCQKLIYVQIMLKFDISTPRNSMSIINYKWGGNGCSLVVATPTGSYFGCQKLIYEPIRLKLGSWSPSNWVSLINNKWVSLINYK